LVATSPDSIKLSVDAGFDPHSGHAGIGFIARNHVGEVLFSGWSSDKRCRSAEEAECLVAWIGLKTYPRLLEWAPLARIRLLCDGMLIEGRVQKSF
jgi:hypothetical protein